ncbi:MAG: peptidylprolyl isomerase [Phycisphaerae bacterium]|nr:peptidylprolyl isomerase [Phycisphaerae bacterium]
MKSTVAGFVRRISPFVGLLAVGVMIGGSGCQKKAPPASDTAAPAQAPASSTPAEAPKEDKVAVTVNGSPIMESQVQRYLDLEYKPLLAKYAAQAPQLAAQQEKVFRENITQNLITRQLLEEQAKLAGIQVTPEELTAEMTTQLSSLNPPRTIEEYKKAVEEQGGDFDGIKRILTDRLKYHKLFESKFASTTKPTEADAKKYYDENTKEFQVPEQVRASHILIRPTDPNTDPNQAKAQAKAKAEDLLKKVKGGADFATVAKENSDCPSKAQGGDLGLFTRDKMVKPFADAAFAMKVGEISGLVESPFGYHIIKVTEHHDPNQTMFEKAKTEIIGQLTEQKMQEAIDTYVKSLRQSAKIVFPSGPAAPAPQPASPKIAVPADANAKK